MVRNEELYQRINPEKNLMQKLKKRKLRLFGHVCRMKNERNIKTLMFGMMDGVNKRGRPHKEWLDDIEEWCGGNIQRTEP